MPSGNNAPNWYTKEYQTMVRHYYQTMGFELTGVMTPPAKIEGSTLYWPYMGEFYAEEVTRNDASNYQNVAEDLIDQKYSHYEVQARRNLVDLDQTTIDGNAAHQRGMAFALGRKHTYLGISTMLAPAGLTTAGSTAAAWNLTYASTACATLFDQVEDDSEAAICLLPHMQFQQMMSEPEFSSSDFTGPDLPFIKKGFSKTWNGCHWMAMPKRKAKVDQYFPINNTDELDFPMFVPSAVGSGGPAVADLIRTFVTWNNQIQGGAWDHKALGAFGFKVLQENGIIKCQVKEDSAITYA